MNTSRRTSHSPAAADVDHAADEARLGKWPYRLISLLILLHLGAVVVGPMAAPPSSQLSGIVWSWYRPYLEATFLNHGYKFFAPDPGPGILVRYELELPDGTRREGRFPDLAQQRPRLLYHRHMMLADRLNAPPDFPLVGAYARSYAQHLAAVHGAQQVKLYLVEHRLPAPQEVRDGVRLTDPALYRERLLIEYPESIR